MNAGSRKENASKQQIQKPGSDSIKTEKALEERQ
jgi:hypothetical protein